MTRAQLHGFWALTLICALPAWISTYYLRRAFLYFAKGEYFNLANSCSLRLFAVFIFIQALATPVHTMLSSVLLSVNHPGGEKILALSFGSNDLKTIALAFIFWVISGLLVEANLLEKENQQFV